MSHGFEIPLGISNPCDNFCYSCDNLHLTNYRFIFYNHLVTMNKIVAAYRNRYYISPIDLADSGETNRLHLIFVSPFLFVLGFFNLLMNFMIYHGDSHEFLLSHIYCGIYIFISSFLYLYSIAVKNVSREKAYVLKTIPFYIGYLVFLAAGIFNFFTRQAFNGVITYTLTGVVSICIFTFSPLLFLLGLLIGLGIMAPGIYDNFGLSGLLNFITTAILLFCLSLYKRRSEKKIIMLLKKQKQSLEAKTFGNFTLLYNNKVIKFSRTKSNELMAYLIYKNGSSVKTKELITVLYGADADSTRYGANIRNLIVDIKHTLSELEIQNFFITEYNNFRINPEVIKCDYYDFISGDKQAIKSFNGAFMSQFKWAEDVTAFMEYKVLKKL